LKYARPEIDLNSVIDCRFEFSHEKSCLWENASLKLHIVEISRVFGIL